MDVFFSFFPFLPNSNQAKDKNGSSVLLLVTGKTDASFARQLLEARCDPHRHNNDFDCPVFRAAKARHIDVMKLLLGHDWAAPEEES